MKVAHYMMKGEETTSQVLRLYGEWLIKNYGKTGTYLVNTKTFLKSCLDNKPVLSQLDEYEKTKSRTIKSFLNRFRVYAKEAKLSRVINDIKGGKPITANVYVNAFLLDMKSQNCQDLSCVTYASILNQYVNSIKGDLANLQRDSVEAFILSSELSYSTKRLYKSVLKSFCQWIISYRDHVDEPVSERKTFSVEKLKSINSKSLHEVVLLKMPVEATRHTTVKRKSLSEHQRRLLLRSCKSQRDRVIISLMGWNGLRPIELTKLKFGDIKLKKNMVSVRSRGITKVIALFKTPKQELQAYMRKMPITTGKLLPDISKTEIQILVRNYFLDLKLNRTSRGGGRYSLRHTAGQLLYDNGVRLELIQKTLRTTSLESTKIYSQQSTEQDYFKAMPTNF